MLAARAAQEGVTVVTIPGAGQPRAALGRLAFAALGALEAMGLLPTLQGDVAETVRVLGALDAELGPAAQGGEAAAIATWIGDRIPVIWGAEGIGAAAAMRWKTQFNENAKTPAWSATMSELDHNEMVGWVGDRGASHALITVRSEDEDPSIVPRFDLSVDLAAPSGLQHRAVHARGSSPLARLFSLIYVGDYASVYAGLLRGVDPTPVEVLDRLKQALA